MSGNGYGYYYPSNAQNFPAEPNHPNQNWSNWSVEQQQYNDSFGRNAGHHNNQLNHTNNHSNYVAPSRSQNFYNANNRHYQQRRFKGPNQGFPGGPQQNWQRNNYNKRPRPQDSPGGESVPEPKSKTAKKKKKPLSQNIPSKKDWTLEEAEMALTVEKEYNKRFKNHSLIIKFPDLELNRDIVSKFHPSIENVHFQQPSTPRFCFVTLQESADSEMVISHLNKIKFGGGYLTAEYKKDREEDQNIGPEDIDPCTLYVGNLAQEITKEDMVKTYPKGRRIDIGYAKKMKYTRYAFVSFKNVSESIEAFKKTHSTQMYSKSLIVRFRRLHGTVGMPGESKPQSPAKNKADTSTNEQTNNERNVVNNTPNEAANQQNQEEEKNEIESLQTELDLSVVKQEVNSSDDEMSEQKSFSKDFSSPFLEGSVNIVFGQHKPMTIKEEIKQEILDDVESTEIAANSCDVSQPNGLVNVKKEPAIVKNECPEDNDSSSDDDGGGDLGDVNFSSLLNQLEDHSNQIESLRKLVP